MHAYRLKNYDTNVEASFNVDPAREGRDAVIARCHHIFRRYAKGQAKGTWHLERNRNGAGLEPDWQREGVSFTLGN